ncbi:hypothetical protein BLA39750_02863 [Burkholderia lata]|uniref:Major facilitator superfamily (MFS) profile domain-containing protein n=1 Tax=Burkholderia lata (strain ATCC 17760 / DSM 23089 / LMG 22485 / NCIMB 9086 / R18194 / 383) TaxID=482957 RepID=A0A6P2X9I7_BURL3|nr:MFS transporter [Burkholderia lata]VWD05557.1 hypothetical protein BLA39750_02863 [Burkholderia lata]
MSQTTVKSASSTPKRIPIGIVGTAFCLFLISGAVNLQAPLYGLYASAGSYGAGFAAAAFACYVGGLVPMLILLGGLSDRIGRKPPLCAALALAMCATVVLIVEPTLGAVAVSRFLLGMAVGLMSGAGTAFVTEQLPTDASATFGATVVTASTSLGFGLGPLLTSIWPPQTVTDVPITYLVYLPVAFAGIVLLVLMRETGPARASARWLRLPTFPAGGFVYGIAIATAWAASGAIIAVVPLQLAKIGLERWSGMVDFLIICPGLIGVWIGRRLSPRAAVSIGLILAPLGYVMTVAGVIHANAAVTLAGSAIAGVACYGLTYLGGLSATLSLAPPEDKARASAGFFLFAYFGFSVPVVVLGFLGDHIGPSRALILSAAVIVGAALATLACIATRKANR